MKHIQCSGSPYEIGQQHGETAQKQVKGSIIFYKDFFKQKAGLSWTQTQDVARQFLPYLEESWPDYVAEMKGIADGAGVDFESIVALNVRTEIAYGMLSDGCTAFSWNTADASYLAQNWDWSFEQSQNIISLHITQPGKPIIHMMSEGGIIGKIGLNSAGVSVTLNAIQARGVTFNKTPVHLALRTVLNSTSRQEAQSTLLKAGVAAACHITIADSKSGGIGLECTSADIIELNMDSRGVCTHSNHLIKEHEIDGKSFLEDSPVRLARIGELITNTEKPTSQKLADLLKDERGFPTAICRAQTEKSTMQTLFSIVMNLTQGTARVQMGRPTEDGEVFDLKP